jgi:hypothetical protein
MVQIIKSFQNSSVKVQIALSVAGLCFYMFISSVLDASYKQSMFPVPYFIQQTCFDAAKIKEWYAYMTQQNTFNIYLRTQFIDFAFIASVIFAGFTVWTLAANFFSRDSFFNIYGYKMAFMLPIAAAFDVLENVISFFMIADPVHFANAWVIPYSTFAVLKFVFWSIALLWMVVLIICLPVHHMRRHFSQRTARRREQAA